MKPGGIYLLGLDLIDYDLSGPEEEYWSATFPFNMLSRCPVLAVPSGFTRSDMPTGIQIVGLNLGLQILGIVEQCQIYPLHSLNSSGDRGTSLIDDPQTRLGVEQRPERHLQYQREEHGQEQHPQEDGRTGTQPEFLAQHFEGTCQAHSVSTFRFRTIQPSANRTTHQASRAPTSGRVSAQPSP